MGRRPPGPKGGLLAGNLDAFERDRLGFLQAAHREFGDVVQFDRRTTLVSGPDLPEEVLLRRSDEFVVREDFLQRRIPADELDQWMVARRLLNPQLRRGVVTRVVDGLVSTASEVLTAEVGRPWDVVSLVEQITSKAMAQVYFGLPRRDVAAASAALLDELAHVIGNPFSLPAAIPTPTRRRIAQRADGMRQLIRELLDERARRPDDHDDVAALLVAGIDHADQQMMHRLSNLVMGSLLAGHRVPAAATAWLLHLVEASPDATFHARLAAEAEQFHDGRRSLEQLPVARAAVAESLRLYPPTWLIARTAVRPFSLAGYELPTKNVILISPYVVHRDLRSFHRPEEFDPLRWVRARPPRGSYFPFGLGPRACPGNHLATATMAVVLLLTRSRVRLVVSGTPQADPRTTLLPRGLSAMVSAGALRIAHRTGEALPGGLAGHSQS